MGGLETIACMRETGDINCFIVSEMATILTIGTLGLGLPRASAID